MKVGIFGFGRAGRSVATVFLQSPDVELEWVVRRSTKMEHRSVPEFLGFPSNDPGLIYSREEFTADELFADYKAFVAKIHGALPEAKILFLSVKPSIARWKLIDEQRKANKLIEEHAKTDKRLMYVDMGSALLGPDGQPRKDLLKDDGLHLNEEGYKVWNGILTPILAEIAK